MEKINNHEDNIVIKKNRKKIISYDVDESRKAKVNNSEEKVDNMGDTKVFQIIKKDENDVEKRKQAIKNENVAVNDNEKNKNEKIEKAGKNNAINNAGKKIAIDEAKNNAVINKAMNNSAIDKYEKNIVINSAEKNLAINNSQKNLVINKTEQKYEIKASNNILKIVLIIIILVLITVVVSTIFGIIVMNSNKIIKGVRVNNVNISNYTNEAAIQHLDNVLNNNEANVITIKRNNYEKQIRLNDINGKFDIEKIVNNAYDIGRNSDILSNNYTIIKTFIFGENLYAAFTYDEELLKQRIDEISLELPDLATESSYIIEGNKLIIKNSTSGMKINQEQFKQLLVDAFSTSQKEFEIPLEEAKKQEINIKKIHDDIYKEPVNAYYTTNPLKVYKEKSGLDFAISLEEATKLVQKDKTEYIIELKEIKPEITLSDIGEAVFPNDLGTFTTTYGTADVNRNANIALAAQSINSVVLMPGETFSYNDLIGECSTRTGYKMSTIYLNGELSTGVGGGICQVSTTLYNAVLRANLEVVERRNHSLGVTYVPAGHDAMVNIGTSDFKFKNNREYPIKVIAYVNPGSVTCAIKGIKQDVEYEVKLESRTIEKTDAKYKVETFKVLYLNGKVVSRTWLSTDTYKYH